MENPFQKLSEDLEAIKVMLSVTLEKVQKIEAHSLSFENEEILDINGLCSFLKITKSTAYKYTCANYIPYYKQGGKVFFLRSELMGWIKTGRIKAKFEIEQEARDFIIKHRNSHKNR